MMAALGRFLANKRNALVLVVVVLAAAIGAGLLALRVEQDDDLLAFLPADNPVVAEFHAMNRTFGGLDVALVGMEGEMFVRYQLDLEAESPLPATVLCGYANGCVGYVPTADEYPRGGYEIEEAYKVYPSVQMLAPESEAMIREGAKRLLKEVTAPA